MKLQSLLVVLIFVASAALAQVPQKFNYQAVARDNAGNVMIEKTLGVRISILDGTPTGTSLYSETHTPLTNKQGLFSIQIGAGTPSGSFASVTWGATPRFLKVEIDAAGGTSYSLLGTSQLLSVPFAFTADKLTTPLKVLDLADVSINGLNAGQILKWNGSAWVASDGGGSIVTSASLSGDGSSASPLTISPGASNGQVLQWNGSEWKPATISGGVGDNWGTQTVSTTSALSGNGTAASPLNLATTGATNGSVMKFNGTVWTPAPDAGDNWGTAKVNTSTQFEGDGTPVNPIKLASQGAQNGQILKWDGATWVPGDAAGFTLPFNGLSTEGSYAFRINNSVGTGIVGINSSASGNNVYGVQGVATVTTSQQSAGLYGRHGSTGNNGYGVYGIHEGAGSGVFGVAMGNGGAGVFGRGTQQFTAGVYGENINLTSGEGVVGKGNTGVEGTSTTATGIGVFGQAQPTAWAGWFSGRVKIQSNSTVGLPGLLVRENETTGFSRIQMDNNISGKYWMMHSQTTNLTQNDYFGINHFGSGDLFSIRGSGLVGIGTVNPTARLDVNGSIRFTGSLVTATGNGLPGQTLHSAGTNAPVWLTETNLAYNKTYLYDQTGTASAISVTSYVVPNFENMAFSTESANAKVIINFSHSQLVSNGTGDVDLQVEIGIIRVSDGAVINRAVANDFILNNKKKSFSYTHHCALGAGSYRAYVYLGTNSGGKFNATGTSGNTSSGQVTIQVIQE